MEFSIILLKKTMTLLLMIFMGFLSVKSGKVKSSDSIVLSQLCFDWVIPLSLINSFLIEYTEETARDFRFACLAFLLAVPFYVCLTLLLRRPLHLNPSEQGSLMFTNSAGMTLPLAQSLLGNTGVLLCAPHMGLQNLLIFTLLPVIMGGADGRETVRFDLKRIFLNRNILAIVTGLILFLSRFPLPSVLRDTISGVGGMLGPVSMFMIGMLMADVDFQELLARRELYLVCILRLIGYPLIAMGIILLSGITRRLPYTRDILLVLVMCISSPAATLVTQMATVYRGTEEAGTAGSLNVITTLLCVLTIPLMVFLYQILC